MGNTINNNYNYLFGNVGSTDKAAPGAGRKDAKAAKEKDSFAQSASSVELSSEGLAALARQRTQAASEAEDGMKSSEEKLSPKAQAHLAKLREKYGDFDFVVAESIDNPEALTKDSTKEYSVILTRAELEKMAED